MDGSGHRPGTPPRDPPAWHGRPGKAVPRTFKKQPPPPGACQAPSLFFMSFQMAPRPFPPIAPPSRAAHRTGRGAVSDSAPLYQVPVYTTEESVRLDVGKSSLRPAAEPLLRVLGVRVQMRTSQRRARRPLIPVPSRGTGLPSPGPPPAGPAPRRRPDVPFTGNASSRQVKLLWEVPLWHHFSSLHFVKCGQASIGPRKDAESHSHTRH